MDATFYHTALVLHIVGITVMAGTSFIDLVTFRIFCKAYFTDMSRGIVLENYLNKLQRFLGTGMLLILISGIAMMVKLHEVWGAQLWFRIKMLLLLLIIINGLGFRRTLGKRLNKLVSNNAPGNIAQADWNTIQRSFLVMHTLQLSLFIVIFVLSVFKFNT